MKNYSSKIFITFIVISIFLLNGCPDDPTKPFPTEPQDLTLEFDCDSILYKGKIYSNMVKMPLNDFCAVFNDDNIYFYNSFFGSSHTNKLSDSISNYSILYKLISILGDTSLKSGNIFKSKEIQNVYADIAGVGITEIAKNKYNFENKKRRLVGIKYTNIYTGEPDEFISELILEPRGDLFETHIFNALKNMDISKSITFLDKSDYSRDINTSSQCEAFGGFLSVGIMLPIKSVLDFKNIEEAIEADSEFLVYVNALDLFWVFVELMDNIVGVEGWAECGEAIVSHAFTPVQELIQNGLANNKPPSDIADEVIITFFNALIQCACVDENKGLCKALKKIINPIGEARMLVDDGILRPLDILTTPVYGKELISNCEPKIAGSANSGPVRSDIFYHEPIDDIYGDIFTFTAQDIYNNWSKRNSEQREIFENAAFRPDKVELVGDILGLKASFNGYAINNSCKFEYGSQVTFENELFNYNDEYTYSVLMKPTSQKGIVSAFFVHLLDENTNNSQYCYNNHEIDIEVLKMYDNELRCYFTSWTRALNPWGGDTGCEYQPNKWADRQQEANYIVLDNRFCNEFHKYSFRWTKNKIEFYIDDVFIVEHNKVVPFKPAPLKINTWSNIGWAWEGQDDNVSDFYGKTQIKKVCVSTKRPGEEGDCKLNLTANPSGSLNKDLYDEFDIDLSVTAQNGTVDGIKIGIENDFIGSPEEKSTTAGKLKYHVKCSKTGLNKIKFIATKPGCTSSETIIIEINVDQPPPPCKLNLTANPSGSLNKDLYDEFDIDLSVTAQNGTVDGVKISIVNDFIDSQEEKSTINGKLTYKVNCSKIGLYKIKFTATKPGCTSSETIEIEINVDQPPPPCTLEVSVDPQSQNVNPGGFFSFTVIVTSQDMPVEGAKVTNKLPWGPNYESTTDSEGKPKHEIKDWRVPGDQTGGNYSICFNASKSGCTSGSGCGTLKVSPPGTLTLNYVCPPETLKVGEDHWIAFKVTDQNGKGVEKAKITLTHLRWIGITPEYLYTDGNGTYSYKGTVPQGEEGKVGDYTFYASKDGYTKTSINRCYINVSE